ncbi:hypothetical protein BKA58DRAFT_39481 [Alternaria rosae]|uniref:uncharacterized protein n=1 Tax=Alternaria rosae TaxID=1187941 RepID=UPI001E8EE1FD|nr:uncharacterized protein BKA58DRAFT_72299 [Alternaria rosae]XP_046021212.1 uncharacterized protein BKA58DRAFT_39481 [Alternaria rosae]KAH6851602.1 hypothetical protein BKA58DRAFT_72299 [Alternaria rosae]KAH6860784.1 hypothetical protein BKA58DRAFT_39481 [Alternaria rosae]
MFLTSPPCKVLGIYALSPESARPSPEGLQSVKRLLRANGIRVGDLLRQIRQLMPMAIRCWRDNSQTICQHIEREDWTRMSSHSCKCRALGGPGFPKLFGFLEFAEDFRATSTQCIYLGYQRDWTLFPQEWNEPVWRPTEIFSLDARESLC